MSTEKKISSTNYQFGTFKGVFTPNILTILGVIMYLRFGWVLAHAGLVKTLLIVTFSTLITLLTAFSISQLATNSRVGTGGAYYIISRSLGAQAGAAIGIPLFFAQAFSIAFYIIGFAESLAGYFPDLSVKVLAVSTLLILMFIAYVSANLALKIQFFILLAIIASLISFFMGSTANVIPMPPNSTPFVRESFWTVFAIFFPAVTGILSGLSMSGDLKQPSKSIPAGTIAAVLVSYGIYMLIPIFIHRLGISADILNANPLIMQQVAKWGALIMIGLWGATLSSAVGCILGAPRTLQALSKDNIVIKSIGRGYGKNNEPRVALLLSCLIALFGIFAGNLDMLASILTMFFLTTYGLLNFAAAMEGMIANPSWRPGFKIHWGFPLAGAIGCIFVMLLINVGTTIVVTLISIGIYFLMHQKKLNAYWGDMKFAILALITRFSLYKLARCKPHEKSWRPNILVLSGSPTSRWHLIMLADAISHGKGFLTVVALLPDADAEQARIDSMRTSVESYLESRRIPAIVRIQRVGKNTLEGAKNLIEYYGFGPLVPNTILLGLSEKEENKLHYANLLLTTYQKNKNLILVHEADRIQELKDIRIDVWWRRGGKNAGLILALAYLLMTSPEWRGAKLILKSVLKSTDDKDQSYKQMHAFLENAHIDATVELITNDSFATFSVMRESSSGADLVLLGLRAPEPDETVEQYAEYYWTFITNLRGFPATAIVLAAEDLDFQKIFELHESAT